MPKRFDFRQTLVWRWLTLRANRFQWRRLVFDYAVIYGFSGAMLWLFAPESALSPQIHWQNPALDQKFYPCSILQVFDGDTIGAMCDSKAIRIRLHGIDAPELAQIPYGTDAQSALATLLPSEFWLEVHGQDIYGRTLGTLHDNHRNINLLLVRLGYAVAYEDKNTPPIYTRAERDAKREQRGVWQAAGLQQRPKIWRRYY